MEINGSNVVRLLAMIYPVENALDEVNNLEIELVERIVDAIRGEIDFDADGLTLSRDAPDESGDDFSSDEDKENSPTYSPSKDTPKRLFSIKYSREKMKKIVEMRDDGKSLKTIRNSYPKINSLREIRRMKDQLSTSKRLICDEIDEELFQLFLQWLNAGFLVRDQDLKMRAVAIAREKGSLDFKGSYSYIHRFKKRHRIVSRKVTRFVTTKRIDDLEAQMRNQASFRAEIRSLLGNFDNTKVYNSDQTGLKLELRGGRTLSFKGTKQVEAIVQRKNATTHSITLQPVISANGELQTPMLVCFNERNAPRIFNDQLAEFSYLKCIHSTSGLMTSDLTSKWIGDVFLPEAGDGCSLLVDSWSGYNRTKEQFRQQIEFVTIPKGATGDLQPLDVFFNRQLKAFYRRLTEILLRYKPEFVVSIRRNVGLLLNLTVHQFTAPRFKNMIRYAWYQSGYLAERPDRFVTPEKFCLSFEGVGQICRDCDDLAIGLCSHCEEFLCVEHYVLNFHSCTI